MSAYARELKIKLTLLKWLSPLLLIKMWTHIYNNFFLLSKHLNKSDNTQTQSYL